jgi:hypothetical protein
LACWAHPVERFWHWTLQGELALVRGDPAGAAMAFSASELPKRRGVSLDIPGAVVTNKLARLLEQAGDRDAARTEYSRFLDLWQHADANLLELAEARRALAVK